MPSIAGTIRKMKNEPGEAGAPVRYALPIGDSSLPINPLIGKPVSFRYTGRIFCLACGKATKTSFSQGHCFNCMQSLAACDMCIVRPETCHYHLGTCREPAWGEAHCFIEHTVYLANSSGIKVGITRAHQMKTRWMDQGAIQALPIAKVKTRRESGLVEVQLAQVVPDKTNWRALLKGDNAPIDLKAHRDALFASWPADLPGEKLDAEEYHFRYPVTRYPAKITSFNLDKNPEVKGELLGVKGQYLLLDTGVINMRKYGGYELDWDLPEAVLEAPAIPAMEKISAAEPSSPTGKASSAAGLQADQTTLF